MCGCVVSIYIFYADSTIEYNPNELCHSFVSCILGCVLNKTTKKQNH